MNFVQRMMGENWKFVTSLELAEATGISHEAYRQWVATNRHQFEKEHPLDFTEDYDVFNQQQALLACLMAPGDTDESWALTKNAIDLILDERKKRGIR